jgi:hypothetical protein
MRVTRAWVGYWEQRFDSDSDNGGIGGLDCTYVGREPTRSSYKDKRRTSECPVQSSIQFVQTDSVVEGRR